ncbi:MAG: helix-turn-helix transcriptional regulator [Acidimicrobiales bacterium]|nr:helix-turn-helix transcriptional regulator [Acidimicrobiales bacterium]
MPPSDVAQVQRLLEAIGGVTDTAQLSQVLIAELLQIIPGVSASYNEVNLATGRAFARIAPEPPPAWWARHQPTFEANMHEHPLLVRLQVDGTLAPSTWLDVDPEQRFRATTLFRDFYRPLGIESQLVAGATRADGTLVAVSVNRDGEDFTERERALLGVAKEAAELARRAVALDVERRALHAVLVDEGWQVLGVTGSGVVVSASDGEVGVGESAGAPVAAALDRHVPQLAGGVGHPSLVRVADPRRARRAVVAAGALPPHLVVLRQGATTASGRLRALGLTPRQAAVAELLATGASNAEIAEILSISPATVKKHLEAIYARLGVARRAGAVATLTAGGTSDP